MTFIALKKFWSWIKAYWWIPAIIIAIIIITIVTQKVPSSLTKIIDEQRSKHKEEVQTIEAIHDSELERREKALEIYHETIKKIEEKYEKDSKELTVKEKKKIKKIVEETQDDPEALAERLAAQMGFVVVKENVQ